ncbi:MAG: C39 family peptidase [Methanothrix sp.]|nr:C39 family peptidase [Methanothrix sp.]
MKLVLLAVLISSSILASAWAEDLAIAEPSNDTLKTILFGVPDVRQSTNYSCGAAAFQAVLNYWGGQDLREGVIMEKLNATFQWGTSPDEIVRVARDMGFEAEFKENLTLEDLEASIKAGVPVIVAGQAWRDEGTSWADDWEDGHYMVVIGLDEKNVYLEDPSLLGSRGYIPRQEFVERWHDYRYAPPSYTAVENYISAGIFIRGKEPAKHPLFMHVD